MKNNVIRNADMLDKEILRQKEVLEEKEKELLINLEHFGRKFSTYVFGSFSGRVKEKISEKRSFFESLLVRYLQRWFSSK